MSRRFHWSFEAYFLSVDEDDDEEGELELEAAPPVEPAAPDAPMPEPEPPAVDEELPVPLLLVVASAPEEGEGVGVVDDEDEEDAGALEAGAGVVTVFSSFLQAVRPTARRAAIRSERVMSFLSYRGVNELRANETSCGAKERLGHTHKIYIRTSCAF